MPVGVGSGDGTMWHAEWMVRERVRVREQAWTNLTWQASGGTGSV